MAELLKTIWETTGLSQFSNVELLVKTLIMYVIVGVLVFLAVVKKYEPLLLLPIAIGMLLANLPGANLFHMELFMGDSFSVGRVLTEGGLVDILYLGVKLGIYPSIIFLGVGAMTDFSPLIANPITFFLGGAAQFGVFAAFIFAIALGFGVDEAAAIGIIGGADGPTAILVTKELAPQLLGAIAIAAYSYMALIPMIQPPLMRLLTTKKERSIKMKQLRPVSKLEKILPCPVDLRNKLAHDPWPVSMILLLQLRSQARRNIRHLIHGHGAFLMQPPIDLSGPVRLFPEGRHRLLKLL